MLALVRPEEVWEAQTATGEVGGKTAAKIIGRLPSLGLAVARASSTNVLVAQWIAHQTSNLGVAGSNPVEHEISLLLFLFVLFFQVLLMRGRCQTAQAGLFCFRSVPS